MNKRIEELAEQAGLVNTWEGWVSTHQEHAEGVSDEFLERFAELVRQDEREACARLCDDISEGLVGDDVDGAWGAGHCARAIEARGEK